jgi:hypothetical protein
MSSSDCSNAHTKNMEIEVKQTTAVVAKVFSLKKPKLMFVKLAKTSTRKTERESTAAPVVACLRIVRPVRHLENGTSFYRVRFKDLDGNRRFLDIPRRSFAKPSEAVSILLDAHAELPISAADQKQVVVDALDQMGTQPTLNLTKRLGWHGNSEKGPSFVYFEKTFGCHHDLKLDQDTNRNPALGKSAGNLEGWVNGLKAPCEVSDELIMAISIAASGPLYGIVKNSEPAIYHFQGARKPPGDKRAWKSSSGKTLTARAAQSMIGACAQTDLFGFNMTALAVEETCFACNNTGVVIDEEGGAGEGSDGKTIPRDMLAYRLVAGKGRRRSKGYSAANGLKTESWLVPVITTGEDELDSSKVVRKEGARARMVAVPFAPTWQGGTFARVTDPDTRTKLARTVEETISTHYGVAMPAYLERLCKDYSILAPDIVKIIDDFVVRVGAANDTWERRYAEKFGMPLAGALLLARYGIAPWTEDRARDALATVYKASRSLTVSVSEATDMLLTVLREKVRNKKLFPRVEKGKGVAVDAKAWWGVIRTVDGKSSVTVIRPTRFKKLVQPAAAADKVLHELDVRNLLIKDSAGSLTRQVLIKGLGDERVRYVCIKGLVAKTSKLKLKAISRMA